MPAVLGTIPGWITAGGIASILTILLRAQIANRKLQLEEDNAERAADTVLRGEKRGDLHACHEKVDALGQRLDKVEEILSDRERKLNATLVGYRILEVAHEAIDPNSLALNMARSVLRQAFGAAADGSIPLDMVETLGKV